MTNAVLTHSRLQSYRACPRRHYLRYEVGIAPEQDEIALRVGNAFHAAKEAQDLGQDLQAAIAARGDLDPLDMGLVAAMFTVHNERWAEQALEVVATELEFDLPIVNPATSHESRLWRLRGKIDRIYRLPDGRLALSDYKTTTEDLTPGSDYWVRLSLSNQMNIYVIAARALGHDIQTILYDVTQRPLLRPYKKTPADKIQLKRDGTPYANTRLQDETPFDYTVRVADAMRADPARYFARHEIARLDQDLEETRRELWSQQLTIREMQRSGTWYRNPEACISHFRCPFLGICHQHIDATTPVPEGFRKLDDVHPELSKATSGGKPAHATQPG